MINHNDYDLVILVASSLILGAAIFGLAVKMRLKGMYERMLADLRQ